MSSSLTIWRSLKRHKYDLLLAIADASVKRQQYKKESETADGNLSKLQKKLYEEALQA